MPGNDVTCTERSVKNVIYSVILKKCNEDMMDVYVGYAWKIIFIDKNTFHRTYFGNIFKKSHISNQKYFCENPAETYLAVHITIIYTKKTNF